MRRWDILFWVVVAAVEAGLIARDRVTIAVVFPSIALAGYLAARRSVR
jgi:hypothetical protein